MEWPSELYAAFTGALEIEPVEGLTREQVLREMFDETARRAVWRIRGNPANIRGALRWPYTPLGSIVPSCIEGHAKRLTLNGPEWCEAVDALHDCIEQNVHAIIEAFQAEAQPYDDLRT